MEKYFNIGLPKWPALIVKGKSVTREQAMEILIRTDDLWFSSNDREFEAQLNEILLDLDYVPREYSGDDKAIADKLGLDSTNGENFAKISEYKDSKTSDLNRLDLHYLKNRRIVSSWIGGPHGWCDWEGNINCRNYNIGKWPSVEEVYNEWVTIAKAFPYLELSAQLYNGETSEEDSSPVIEFNIKDGKVEMSIPEEPLDLPSFGMADMFSRFNNPYAERGCTIELFKSALEHIRSKTVEVN
jgi:hypothetical protein